jgi:hypothetical protein
VLIVELLEGQAVASAQRLDDDLVRLVQLRPRETGLAPAAGGSSKACARVGRPSGARGARAENDSAQGWEALSTP